jgi:hypothetical protein
MAGGGLVATRTHKKTSVVSHTTTHLAAHAAVLAADLDALVVDLACSRCGGVL